MHWVSLSLSLSLNSLFHPPPPLSHPPPPPHSLLVVMSLTVGFSCLKLPPSGWRDESLMASDTRVICITCTSLNTCIFSVLLFA